MLVLLLGCTDPVDITPITPTETSRTLQFTGERFDTDIVPPDDTGGKNPDVQPNILVIISDDIGIESSACYEDQIGAERAPQPTLAGLCAEGLTFTHTWAYPLCSPTRAALMTGLYGWRTGVGRAIDYQTPPLSVDEVSIADILTDRPHAYIGKWHLTERDDLGHPGALGWQHFSGTIAGTLESYDTYEKTTNGIPALNDRYATSEVVDDALTWLAGQGGGPWVLWVAFNAAHTPFHAPPDELHSYDLTGLDSSTDPAPFFQAMIESMDTEMGRLLDGIDRTNTVIIYVGDNGSMTSVNQSAYPQGHGKGTLGEGGVRVPLVVTGPGIPQGQVDSMVHAVDLHATVLELAGVDVPQAGQIDSISLQPYFDDPAADPLREVMLTELFGVNVPEALAGRAVRNDRFKLVRLFAGPERLYDLRADPTGTENLLIAPLDDEAAVAYLELSDYLNQVAIQAGF